MGVGCWHANAAGQIALPALSRLAQATTEPPKHAHAPVPKGVRYVGTCLVKLLNKILKNFNLRKSEDICSSSQRFSQRYQNQR